MQPLTTKAKVEPEQTEEEAEATTCPDKEGVDNSENLSSAALPHPRLVS